MPMIDSDTLKPAYEAYQFAREAWDTAMTTLAKANIAKVSPLESQRLHDEVHQTQEAMFAAGAELAEKVADAISGIERAGRG